MGGKVRAAAVMLSSSGSFDCGTRGEAASAFARDDGFVAVLSAVQRRRQVQKQKQVQGQKLNAGVSPLRFAPVEMTYL